MPKPLSETAFEQFLVGEYLKFGSITKVFQKHKFNLPISFAGFDRVLNKYGVIKSAGPNSKLSESLYILRLLADYKISLTKIYHRFAPKNIQVSTNTLHRILHYTRLGLTRRQGIALIISPYHKPQKVLLGIDQSLTNSPYGQKGDLSLPMGHSKVGEPIRDSIARVLQNEVFTDRVIQNHFPWQIIPKHPKPLICVNVADIQVSVYRLILPSKINEFSSFKLQNLRFYHHLHLPHAPFRPGIEDMLNYCYNLKNIEPQSTLPVFNSRLNRQIYVLAKETIK